jgi:sugar-specific transcriptional regulator TrmB
MRLTKLVEKLGFTDKEARVYLALVELGEGPVSEVSSAAKVKHSTTYLVLESLEEQGLVRQNRLHKKLVYIAEPPNKLMAQLNQKKELITQILPKLLETYRLNKK